MRRTIDMTPELSRAISDAAAYRHQSGSGFIQEAITVYIRSTKRKQVRDNATS